MTEQDVFRALKLKYIRESLPGLSSLDLKLTQQMLAQLQSSAMRIRRARRDEMCEQLEISTCCCQLLVILLDYPF